MAEFRKRSPPPPTDVRELTRSSMVSARLRTPAATSFPPACPSTQTCASRLRGPERSSCASTKGSADTWLARPPRRARRRREACPTPPHPHWPRWRGLRPPGRGELAVGLSVCAGCAAVSREGHVTVARRARVDVRSRRFHLSSTWLRRSTAPAVRADEDCAAALYRCRRPGAPSSSARRSSSCLCARIFEASAPRPLPLHIHGDLFIDNVLYDDARAADARPVCGLQPPRLALTPTAAWRPDSQPSACGAIGLRAGLLGQVRVDPSP